MGVLLVWGSFRLGELMPLSLLPPAHGGGSESYHPSGPLLLLDDVKKSSILKNGIGIEGQKSMQTSKKYVNK